MGKIRCFWLEPTEEIELSLRRYRGGESSKCSSSGLGYHNINAVIERTSTQKLKDSGWPISGEVGTPVHTDDTIPKTDPRWPKSCSCGYEFVADDNWQCNPDVLYRRSDSGELVTLHKAPAGAMWNAHWMGGGHWRVIDGICLCVRTPGGEWCVDGPSWNHGKIQNEKGWERSGKVPDITARPSILIPNQYHGFLTNGFLEEC